MRRSVRRSFTILCAVAGALGGLGAPAARARLFFVPGDPALQGATVVALDASAGFAVGQQQHLVSAGGSDLDFQTAHPQGFFGAFFSGVPSFVSLFPDPVVVDIDPPVGAIGVQFQVAECNGQVTFEGVGGTEQFATQQGSGPLFIGAADLGDIDRVLLEAGCFAAQWTEMRFVPGGAPPPDTVADLSVSKTPRQLRVSQADGSVVWDISVANAGPDDAEEARTMDFLPFGTALVSGSPPPVVLAGTNIVQQGVGSLPEGGDFALELEHDIPPFAPDDVSESIFNCESRMENVVYTTARSIDPDGSDNLQLRGVAFDKESRTGAGEICDNAIDDDCDGRADCSDTSCRSHPACQPPVTYGPNQPWDCFSEDCPFPPAPTRTPPCRIRDVHGNDRSMPSECCSATPPRDALGHPASRCVPSDPNFKTVTPGVNAQGFGYTEAGQLHEYAITYENVGGVDAHDVTVFDYLDEDLDDATLSVQDGGVYDAAERVIRWTDPVVPPATPRTVHFEVEVRSDATPFTRVRNTATIVFPDAVPPQRTDTNTVEHVVMAPGMVEVDPGIVGCQETAPASGEWSVSLFNKGNAFAWNATAEIVDPPASVQVTRGFVEFAVGDDVDPSVLRTVIPLNTTPSVGTVAFTTETPRDPCRALLWRIRWDGTRDGGPLRETLVRVDPDSDQDAVADASDNCPADYNPTQADADADGQGDACEPPPAELPAVDDLSARAKRGKVDVTWTPPAAASSYDLYRSVNGGPSLLVAGGFASPYGVYADTQLTGGLEHCYALVWRAADGTEAPASAPACATPAPRPATPPACGLVGLEAMWPAAMAWLWTTRRRLTGARRRRPPSGSPRTRAG